MSALLESVYFGIVLSVAAYCVGTAVQKKTGLVVCNNLLIAALLVAAVLTVFHIPYDAYYKGGSLINLLLGPATACLAVNIYSKLDLLKKYWLPVLVGCTTGTLVSVGSILLMCRLFGMDRAMTISMLPKSVTTPIASAVAESNGGIVPIAVAAVITTGITSNVVSPMLVKLFRVKDPMAVGLGIGAASHAMGTAKALEMGETEGAMSGLAMGLCGLITAVVALSFQFIV